MWSHLAPISASNDRSRGNRLCASANVKIRSSISHQSTGSMFQPTLGFNCSHASRTGSGYRLPKNRILHVTASEHARDIGSRRVRLGFDVPFFVEIYLPAEYFSIGVVTDRDE